MAAPTTASHPDHPEPLPRAARGDAAISVSGLVKSFGDVRALDGIDFEVAPGTVLGLLGPNGAGKTTAVRVLTTLLRPAPAARASRDSTRSRMRPNYDHVSDWPASTPRSTRTSRATRTSRWSAGSTG